MCRIVSFDTKSVPDGLTNHRVIGAARRSGPSAVWVNRPKDGELPDGVPHHTFYSEANKAEVGYCIYLPPDYGPQEDRRYPVIYNLHGAGDNELHGFDDVKVLDAGIRAGRWPAMVVVLPNGGMRIFYKDSYEGAFMSETLIIREVIPYIDKTYRTIADRRARCIEGHRHPMADEIRRGNAIRVRTGVTPEMN